MSQIFLRDSKGLTGTGFHSPKQTETKIWQCFWAGVFLCLHVYVEQVMPSPESIQNEGQRERGREEKRNLETSTNISGWDLPGSSETWCVLGDCVRTTAQAQVRHLLKKSQLDGKEGQHCARPRNNPTVNCKSKSLAALRYNYIYIYIYMSIYICYVQKTLRYQAPLNHISPL